MPRAPTPSRILACRDESIALAGMPQGARLMRRAARCGQRISGTFRFGCALESLQDGSSFALAFQFAEQLRFAFRAQSRTQRLLLLDRARAIPRERIGHRAPGRCETQAVFACASAVDEGDARVLAFGRRPNRYFAGLKRLVLREKRLVRPNELGNGTGHLLRGVE